MPVFEIEQPDGSVYEVEAPDIETASRPLPPPQKAVGVGEDMLRSGASGIAKGAAYLAGTAGDLRDMANNAGGWIAGKLGVSPEMIEQGKQVARYMSPLGFMPTSQQLLQGAEQAGIQFHKPQTTAGKYAETVGEFVPGAAVGPGGVVAKTAQAVIPGMASESAGRAAQRYMPAAEPYARMAAALVSGRGMAPRPRGPTSEQLINAANVDLKRMGASVKPEVYDDMVARIDMAANEEGIRRFLEPAAVGVIDEMYDQGKYINKISDIHKLRRLAGKVAGKIDKDESRAGVFLKGEISGQLDALQPSDFTGPGGRASVEAMQRALKNYRRGASSQDLTESMEQSKTRAQVFDFGGKDQAIKSELRKITNNPKRLRLYTPEEQALLRDIVSGGVIGRAMSSAGRFSPTRIIPAIGLAELIKNKPMLGTIVGAGAGASQVGGYLRTKQRVRDLDELFRTGKVPTGQRDRLVRALLAGEAGSVSLRGR